MTAHGLRKFFNVELQAARVPREWRYQMMGKKTGPYDENRTRKLFEAYREAYDQLRIFATNNAELEAVKKSLKELQEENRRLREKSRETGGLKREMAEQKRRLDEQQGIVERFMSYIEFEYRERDGAMLPKGILEDMKDKPMGYISKPKKGSQRKRGSAEAE